MSCLETVLIEFFISDVAMAIAAIPVAPPMLKAELNTTRTTTVLRPFVRDYPGEQVPEETLTHPPS